MVRSSYHADQQALQAEQRVASQLPGAGQA
jgi:hypothetical protein